MDKVVTIISIFIDGLLVVVSLSNVVDPNAHVLFTLVIEFNSGEWVVLVAFRATMPYLEERHVNSIFLEIDHRKIFYINTALNRQDSGIFQ